MELAEPIVHRASSESLKGVLAPVAGKSIRYAAGMSPAALRRRRGHLEPGRGDWI